MAKKQSKSRTAATTDITAVTSKTNTTSTTTKSTPAIINPKPKRKRFEFVKTRANVTQNAILLKVVAANDAPLTPNIGKLLVKAQRSYELARDWRNLLIDEFKKIEGSEAQDYALEEKTKQLLATALFELLDVIQSPPECFAGAALGLSKLMSILNGISQSMKGSIEYTLFAPELNDAINHLFAALDCLRERILDSFPPALPSSLEKMQRLCCNFANPNEMQEIEYAETLAEKNGITKRICRYGDSMAEDGYKWNTIFTTLRKQAPEAVEWQNVPDAVSEQLLRGMCVAYWERKDREREAAERNKPFAVIETKIDAIAKVEAVKDKQWWTRKDAAAYFNVSLREIDKKLTKRKPEAIKAKRCRLLSRDDMKTLGNALELPFE